MSNESQLHARTTKQRFIKRLRPLIVIFGFDLMRCLAPLADRNETSKHYEIKFYFNHKS